MISSVSNAFATTNGNSDIVLPENFYPFGQGILEFQEKSPDFCTLTIPIYYIKSINAAHPDSLLNLDDFKHNFFIVIGNPDHTYDYLQVGLPEGSGFPSYLMDLKDSDGKKLRGEFYIDYENLAVILESDVDKNLISENNFEKYFTEQNIATTSNRDTLGPGNYNFGAILLKSDKSTWINNEVCAIHLEWSFVITEQGNAIFQDPLVGVGRLVDVTEEFSPLKQHKLGVNSNSIECKSGLQVILQQSDESGNKRPSCVTPETKIKLIERGWIKIDSGNL